MTEHPSTSKAGSLPPSRFSQKPSSAAPTFSHALTHIALIPFNLTVHLTPNWDPVSATTNLADCLMMVFDKIFPTIYYVILELKGTEILSSSSRSSTSSTLDRHLRALQASTQVNSTCLQYTGNVLFQGTAPKLCALQSFQHGVLSNAVSVQRALGSYAIFSNVQMGNAQVCRDYRYTIIICVIILGVVALGHILWKKFIFLVEALVSTNSSRM